MSFQPEPSGRSAAQLFGEQALRSARWRLTVLIFGVVIVGGGLGVFLAAEAGARPEMHAAIKILIGLFLLALGLNGLVRLAVFGPKTPTQNRVEHSLASTGQVLLGVAELTATDSVGIPLLVVACACVLAALLKRPRRLFRAGESRPVMPRVQ